MKGAPAGGAGGHGGAESISGGGLGDGWFNRVSIE